MIVLPEANAAGRFNLCGPATRDTNDDDNQECGPATRPTNVRLVDGAGLAVLQQQLRQTLAQARA